MKMQPASLLNGGLCEAIDYDANKLGDQCQRWRKLHHVKIFGRGTIDGNGHSGWYDAPFHANRPCLVDLLWVDDLTLLNVTVTDSPKSVVAENECF